MWWKILIMVIILSMVNGYWDEKTLARPHKKKLYKFLMGVTYLVTVAASSLLIQFVGTVIYVYIFGGVLFGVGSILSAINTNLRNIFASVVMYAFFMGIVFMFFGENKIVCIVAGIYFLISIIYIVCEGISNMYHRIDPDVVAERKAFERKVKNGLRLVKMLIQRW